MIHIAIVENDKQDMTDLKRYCKQFFGICNTEICVSEFENGRDFLDTYQKQYDLVLMDIVMPVCDGLQTAKMLRRIDQDVMLIFVTTMIQAVFKGYEVNAFDFITKPLLYSNLSATLTRAMKRLNSCTNVFLKVTFDKHIRFISPESILYIETCGHKLKIQMNDEACYSGESMKSIEERLTDQHFFRCHEAFLVNLNYVAQFSQTEVRIGDRSIPISRGKRDAFLVALTNHVGSVL